MNEIIDPNPKVFKLAEGFHFTEGPVWVNKDGGYLLLVTRMPTRSISTKTARWMYFARRAAIQALILLSMVSRVQMD